jgi:hypothetical protein
MGRWQSETPNFSTPMTPLCTVAAFAGVLCRHFLSLNFVFLFSLLAGRFQRFNDLFSFKFSLCVSHFFLVNGQENHNTASSGNGRRRRHLPLPRKIN